MLKTCYNQYNVLLIHKIYLPLHCRCLLDVGIGRMIKNKDEKDYEYNIG